MSDRLRKEFHVEFRKDEHTSEPASRREVFLFERNDDVVQKAYILKYKGVNPNGTWIYFDSNLTDSFCETIITIIDLGTVDGDLPHQWTWRFKNSG